MNYAVFYPPNEIADRINQVFGSKRRLEPGIPVDDGDGLIGFDVKPLADQRWWLQINGDGVLVPQFYYEVRSIDGECVVASGVTSHRGSATFEVPSADDEYDLTLTPLTDQLIESNAYATPTDELAAAILRFESGQDDIPLSAGAVEFVRRQSTAECGVEQKSSDNGPVTCHGEHLQIELSAGSPETGIVRVCVVDIKHQQLVTTLLLSSTAEHPSWQHSVSGWFGTHAPDDVRIFLIPATRRTISVFSPFLTDLTGCLEADPERSITRRSLINAIVDESARIAGPVVKASDLSDDAGIDQLVADLLVIDDDDEDADKGNHLDNSTTVVPPPYVGPGFWLTRIEPVGSRAADRRPTGSKHREQNFFRFDGSLLIIDCDAAQIPFGVARLEVYDDRGSEAVPVAMRWLGLSLTYNGLQRQAEFLLTDLGLNRMTRDDSGWFRVYLVPATKENASSLPTAEFERLLNLTTQPELRDKMEQLRKSIDE